MTVGKCAAQCERTAAARGAPPTAGTAISIAPAAAQAAIAARNARSPAVLRPALRSIVTLPRW
ncbi:MAG: hypothetical protein ACR2KV_04935 [Solirubrobacteraceae bacterium]